MSSPTAFLELYDLALPQVFGYLSRRCESTAVAEDLTAETFLAAVAATHHRPPADLNVGWLIGTARHKLVDHWRRTGRQREALAELWDDNASIEHAPDEGPLEVERTREVLSMLMPQHRAVLTLRYLDGMNVPEVADALDRSVHATESLLMRAKTAFRAVHDTLVQEADNTEFGGAR